MIRDDESDLLLDPRRVVFGQKIIQDIATADNQALMKIAPETATFDIKIDPRERARHGRTPLHKQRPIPSESP